MNVSIFDEQSALSPSPNQIEALVCAVLAFEGQSYDEVAIHFVDKAQICRLHDEFFGDPSPTDCISFPMDSEEDVGFRVLGDVFVCPEVAIEYAEEHGEDPYKETSLYVVHGLLHLLGFDDQQQLDIQEMREAEKRNMEHLERQGLLLHPK